LRTWREIKGLMLADLGDSFLVRFHIFDEKGEKFRGGDMLLEPAEICELYTLLKEKAANGIKGKSCPWCIHYRWHSCLHPDGRRGEDECIRENRKHFKPKIEI